LTPRTWGLSIRKSGMSGLNQPNHQTAHPGRKKSFDEVEAQARDVLRERGFTEKQIEAELKQAKRDERH
jgi:hypothetical protein